MQLHCVQRHAIMTVKAVVVEACTTCHKVDCNVSRGIQMQADTLPPLLIKKDGDNENIVYPGFLISKFDLLSKCVNLKTTKLIFSLLPTATIPRLLPQKHQLHYTKMIANRSTRPVQGTGAPTVPYQPYQPYRTNRTMRTVPALRGGCFHGTLAKTLCHTVFWCPYQKKNSPPLGPPLNLVRYGWYGWYGWYCTVGAPVP